MSSLTHTAQVSFVSRTKRAIPPRQGKAPNMPTLEEKKLISVLYCTVATLVDLSFNLDMRSSSSSSSCNYMHKTLQRAKTKR